MNNGASFNFDFTLDVLNHLGRQLYRNFITVLGEAISNSWDADADNVIIDITDDRKTIYIFDDGHGMDANGIKEKFLTVGYSKRIDNNSCKSKKNRPFIGAKGIGKLALLSCADTVTVISKTQGTHPVGCTIDNKALDEAIKENKRSYSVPLPNPQDHLLEKFTQYLQTGQSEQGTLLVLEGVRMSNSTDAFLRTALAMSYRFTLIDTSFKLVFQGKEIGVKDLESLAEKTEYIWVIKDAKKDPFVDLCIKHNAKKFELNPSSKMEIEGFLATTEHPKNLSIYGTGVRTTVDFFVNGRIRQRNIFENVPTARYAEAYLYGQIHCDSIDNAKDKDPFTTARDGLLETNQDVQTLMEELKRYRSEVIEQWSKQRGTNRDKPEGVEKTLLETAKRMYPERDIKRSSQAFDKLLREIAAGGKENQDYFYKLYIIENIIRKLTISGCINLSKEATNKANGYAKNEKIKMPQINTLQSFRANNHPSYYLGTLDLLKLIPEPNRLTDEEMKLLNTIRNVINHSCQLSEDAKKIFPTLTDPLIKELEKLATNYLNTKAGNNPPSTAP